LAAWLSIDANMTNSGDEQSHGAAFMEGSGVIVAGSDNSAEDHDAVGAPPEAGTP
jgi:hypothetical protein